MNRYVIPEEYLQEIYGERYNESVKYDISDVLPKIRWLILPDKKILQQLVDARVVFEHESDITLTEYHYFWANIPEFEQITP